MKELELEDEIFTLQDIAKEYLEQNSISMSFMSRKTGIEKTSLHRWLRGERELNGYSISRIKDFLNSNYIIPAHMICANLVMKRRLEKEEQKNAE